MMDAEEKEEERRKTSRETLGLIWFILTQLLVNPRCGKEEEAQG